MFGTSAAQFLDSDRSPRREHGQPFLSSHRALAVCTREFASLSDAVVRGVAALRGADAEKPTVRRSPDRCIVQLGPVALTLAWLRANHDAVAEGELLVIVWRGTVAPRNEHRPERPSTSHAALAATPLWEEILTATGESEAAWGWQPQGDDAIGCCSSTQLAARCVARLDAAYHEREVPASHDQDAVRPT